MARNTLANPANPMVFGEDPVRLAWSAVGVAVTGVVNDQYVNQLTKNINGNQQGLTAQLIDAGTTAISAFATGELVGMIDRGVGQLMKRGGMILAAARTISAFWPAYSLSYNFPKLPSFGVPALPPPAPANGAMALPTPTVRAPRSGL